MDCANCLGQTKKLKRRGVDVEWCPVCRHCWIEPYYLGRYIVASGSELDRQSVAWSIERLGGPATPIECPVCARPQVTLFETDLAETPLLVCPRCRGVLVPKAELDRLYWRNRKRWLKDTMRATLQAAIKVLIKLLTRGLV